ncbi:MAG: Lrp/AsnC family transcriptional regulator [Nitrososphaeria archaeon]
MDKIDKKIVMQLQRDGRVSLTELAKITGYSSMGVKKRINRLLKEESIKVTALLNIDKLKLCAAIVMLEMENADALQNLLERFKDCPRVVHIFSTLGGYNLIALIVAENQETLESISIEKCSLRSSKGIRRSEFYPIGNIYFSHLLPVREYLASKERTKAPCNVDCRPCNRYRLQKCVACPVTRYYRGTL